MGSRGTTNVTRTVGSVFKRAAAWMWVLPSCTISSVSVVEVTCGDGMTWEGAKRGESGVGDARSKWVGRRRHCPKLFKGATHGVHTLLLARSVALAELNWGGGGSVTVVRHVFRRGGPFSVKTRRFAAVLGAPRRSGQWRSNAPLRVTNGDGTDRDHGTASKVCDPLTDAAPSATLYFFPQNPVEMERNRNHILSHQDLSFWVINHPSTR